VASTPLPPASQVEVSPEALDLRKKLLGTHALDPDFVTLHWFGVSGFVVTLKGHLFLFEAWEIVGAHKDYVLIGREEMAGLEPEAILAGHGDFDHAADIGYVAGRSGALVVGSQEVCDTAKEDAEADGLQDRFACVVLGTEASPAPGTMTELKLFSDVDPVTVLRHVHSAATAPSESNQAGPFLPVFDPMPYVQNPNTSPEEAARFLESVPDPRGGLHLYHFRVGEFTLLLGDSSGPIFDYPAVRKALDSFPGCVDVMSNAIVGFDQPVSGLQDPRLYVENAHPKVFLPNHGDAWAPVISAGQAAYEDEWNAEMAKLANPPQTDLMKDPGDYMVERAYRVSDQRWVAPMAGSSCAKKATVLASKVQADKRPAELPATGVGSELLGVWALAGACLLARAMRGPAREPSVAGSRVAERGSR
jgi:hypothetical protein